MTDNGYLYILDHQTSEIYEITLTEEDEDKSTEDILRPYSLNVFNCTFMYTQEKINKITSLNKNKDE